MNNWSIALRLKLGFGLVLLLMLLNTAAALLVQQRVLHSEELARNMAAIVEQVTEWRDRTATQIDRVDAMFTFGDQPSVVQYFEQRIEAVRARVDELEREVTKALQGSQHEALLQDFIALRKRQIGLLNTLMQQIRSGDIDGARSWTLGAAPQRRIRRARRIW